MLYLHILHDKHFQCYLCAVIVYLYLVQESFRQSFLLHQTADDKKQHLNKSETSSAIHGVWIDLYQPFSGASAAAAKGYRLVFGSICSRKVPRISSPLMSGFGRNQKIWFTNNRRIIHFAFRVITATKW